MDTKKLDKLAELLLDTGKRGNLTNFKDNKSSVELLFPSSDELFEKIRNFDGKDSLVVYDPKTKEEDKAESESETVRESSESADDPNVSDKAESESEADRESSGSADDPSASDKAEPESAAVLNEQSVSEDAESEEARKEKEAANKKEAYKAKYAEKIKRSNQVLLYNETANPLSALANIAKKAREFMEETGDNVAYMAFGFIHWKESVASSGVWRAPVLLIPIRLEQTSVVKPVTIKADEDEVVVNPAFSRKLKSEHGAELPEYQDDEPLASYLDKVRNLVEKLQWQVTSECKIGIFSFAKINMYHDLTDNAQTILENPNVRRLLGESVSPERLRELEGSGVSVAEPLIELHSVYDADSSQIEAIETAKSGKSFVLQGPPGTGKSQTITNIIAECLSDGKKVLFVSEKQSALNVVYEKLKQAGLAEFCLRLHSHKANKKEVIADIANALNAAKSVVSSKADAAVADKEKALRQLNEYAEELHKERPGLGKSVYELYEAYSALRSVPDVEFPIDQLETKGEDYLKETVALLEQYVGYLRDVGNDYRTYPWYGYVERGASYQAKAEMKSDFSDAARFLQTPVPLLAEISEKYGTQCVSVSDAYNWKNFFEFAAKSDFITPKLLERAVFDKVEPVLRELKALSEEILAARKELSAAFDDGVFKLDGEDCRKKLTKLYAGFFSRLFSSEYKQLIKSLRLCKKTGTKLSYAEAVAASEKLAEYQRKSAELAKLEEPIKPYVGPDYQGVETDWNAAAEQTNALKAIYANAAAFGNLCGCADYEQRRAEFADFARRLAETLAAYDREKLQRTSKYFDENVLSLLETPCEQASAKLNGCVDRWDMLEHWLCFDKLLVQLGEKQAVAYIDAAVDQNVDPQQIVDAFKKHYYCLHLDRIKTETPALASFSRISQDQTIDVFSEKDKEQFEINKAKIRAALSSERPSPDMAVPGSPLDVLRRESEKKRKQKTVRTLLAETRELILRIKPCFLTSPLSVSTFLGKDFTFDVVVFDEASQIFPQDAIGAVYRAKQTIVVGDSKQMPPSNYFNASNDSESADDEEDGGGKDFESILDWCSACMPTLRLSWHYRSRYEQLIAFSNKNFYDGALVTFPSCKANVPGIGVDYYHVDGVMDRKSHSNQREAEKVVELIYRHFEQYPDRSLGVVAFSQAQQGLIDKLLSKRRQSEPDKEEFFKNDADEPFFIKNLETAQGDERDTIIFSTAYGYDAQGKMLHNFGPLNRPGGGRRLNVAVTRAKHNVQLVSSMRCTDIDLSRTSAEGARLLREYLDYAENGEAALRRNSAAERTEGSDDAFEHEVCEFLRANGFSADAQVGCSGYRIDIGVKRPDSGDYALAVECDGAAYRSSKNARDRDRLRQEILERMGWKFYRVWSTEWFRNKAVEQRRLLEAVNAAVSARADVPSVRPSAPTSPLEEDRPAETYEEAAVETSFEFPEYKVADIEALGFKYLSDRDFRGMIKAILEVEAPLSEELLIKRLVQRFGKEIFGREKVTPAVRQDFEDKLLGYESYGISRSDGFLRLDVGQEVQLRRPGDGVERDIKQIAPEELAAGMIELLKQNQTVGQKDLFRALAKQCGVSRVGANAEEAMNAALALLERVQKRVVVENEQVSLI